MAKSKVLIILGPPYDPPKKFVYHDAIVIQHIKSTDFCAAVDVLTPSFCGVMYASWADEIGSPGFPSAILQLIEAANKKQKIYNFGIFVGPSAWRINTLTKTATEIYASFVTNVTKDNLLKKVENENFTLKLFRNTDFKEDVLALTIGGKYRIIFQSYQEEGIWNGPPWELMSMYFAWDRQAGLFH